MNPGAASLCLLLVLTGIADCAQAAIVVTPPGKSVAVMEEKAFIVFDPLTGVQSTIVRHGFEETGFAFGLLLPVPAPTKVQQHATRLRRVIENRLWPRGKVQRALQVDFVSWLSGCVIPDVGDPTAPAPEASKSGTARAQHTPLGNAPERLHDWLLSNGFTLAPAQTAWIETLRSQGWSFIGFILRPPTGEHRAGTLLYGPVISLTHATAEPVYAAYEPPFALFDEPGNPSTAPIEVSILSEWAVAPQGAKAPAPFYADTFPLKQLIRLRNQAGRVPWSFRRDGTLTGYLLPRPGGDGILRFRRTTPFPRTRPTAAAREQAYRIELPVELIALIAIGFFFGLGRFRRRPGRRSALLG